MSDWMIEIRVDQTGESAWADSPEHALGAAKQLLEEAYRASGGGIRDLTASFYVDGECIRARVPERLLWQDRVYKKEAA